MGVKIKNTKEQLKMSIKNNKRYSIYMLLLSIYLIYHTMHIETTISKPVESFDVDRADFSIMFEIITIILNKLTILAQKIFAYIVSVLSALLTAKWANNKIDSNKEKNEVIKEINLITLMIYLMLILVDSLLSWLLNHDIVVYSLLLNTLIVFSVYVINRIRIRKIFKNSK